MVEAPSKIVRFTSKGPSGSLGFPLACKGVYEGEVAS